jgi:XTP/dITP diphosphohydrolase
MPSFDPDVTVRRLHTLVVATGNAHKLEELRAHCHNLGTSLKLRSIDEWVRPFTVDESGSTFAENAFRKAAAAMKISNLPVLADDSGLMVDALKGDPGVHSAYYAGKTATAEQNNLKLLTALQGVPTEKRTARLVCHLTLLMPTGERLEVEETVSGRILVAKPNDQGWGYEPFFWLESQQCTMGELPLSEKFKINHRGKAIQAMLKKLQSMGLIH